MKVFKREVLDQKENIYEVWYGTDKKCAIIIINEKTKKIFDIDNASDMPVDWRELQQIANKYVETLD